MSADPHGPQWQMESEEDAVSAFREQGYVHDFVAAEDGLRCPECDVVGDPRTARIDHTFRHEGITNPGDESVVFALSNGPCGHKGVLATAYGPDASPEAAEVVRLLGQGADDGPADDPITAREAAEQALIVEGESEAGGDLGDEMP